MNKYEIKDIKAGWQDSSIANTYDDKRFSSLSGRLSNWLDKRAISKSLYSVPKTSKILDMPCGTGRISQYLIESGYNQITCADISDDMLEIASARLTPFQGIKFYNTDAENTPFKNNFFEIVVSIRFMGHIPKKLRINILKEMGRICKGTIIIEYPVTNPFARLIKTVFKTFTVKKVLQDQWTWHYLSMSEARREVNEAGFSTQKIIRKLSFFSESAFFSIKPE